MKRPSFRTARSTVAWLQAALLLGLPFIRFHNESILRFDVPSLKLYFFGSVVWISEAYFLLLAFLLVLSGLMLVTVLYGRIWCGWACPQTVLSDVARYIERISTWFSRHRVLQGAASHGILFLFSIAVSASLLWYFVSPYDMISDVAARSLGPWTTWSWAVFSLLIYLDIAFIRQKFCSAVCPYARLQSAFFDEHTLTIAFDRTRQEECLGCEACTRVCPSGMDIRQGLQVECINCAECIDACARQMEKRENKPLVGYYRGSESTAIPRLGIPRLPPGVESAFPRLVRTSSREKAVPGGCVVRGSLRLLPDGASLGGKVRPRVIGLSIVLALVAILFVHQISVRMPADLFVVRDEGKAYHQVGIKNLLMNGYQVAIENRTLHPASFTLTITGIHDIEVVGVRNPIMLPPNSRTTMSVYVFVRRKNLTERITRLRFMLQSVDLSEIRINQEAPFVYPERTDKGVEI